MRAGRLLTRRPATRSAIAKSAHESVYASPSDRDDERTLNEGALPSAKKSAISRFRRTKRSAVPPAGRRRTAPPYGTDSVRRKRANPMKKAAAAAGEAAGGQVHTRRGGARGGG